MDESSDVDEEEAWDEDWGEVEGEECTSLFSNKVLPSVQACCDHDAKQHEFDIREYIKQHALDDYATFKCINFIREVVASNGNPISQLQQGPQVFSNDRLLKPVLQDDALLFHDFAAVADQGATRLVACREASTSYAESIQQRLEHLEADNEALLTALQHVRVQAVPEELRNEINQPGQPGSSARTPHSSTAPAAATAAATSCAASQGVKDVDNAYFDSYSYFDIHREMLEDKVRTEAYRQALEQNPDLIKGAKVLDIGCGTGILSLFAARAGAAQVVAVDGADRIADFAVKNCIANGLHESVGGSITVVAGRVEELDALPFADKSADVLVSEWMGYALLFESMLESVLLCRDRWLKPGGAMMPDTAVIHVAAGGAAATGLDFWDDVYGFTFPDIKEESRKHTLTQPLVAPVNQSALLSTSAVIKEFDLTSMRKDDVDFHSEFELAVEQAGDCHALVMWFDTSFSSRFCQEAPCVLSTSPAGTPTHWVQTVFVLEHVQHVAQGEKLRCRCSFARSDKHRSIDISFEVQHVGVDGKDGGKQTQVFVMAVSSQESGVEEAGRKSASGRCHILGPSVT